MKRKRESKIEISLENYWRMEGVRAPTASIRRQFIEEKNYIIDLIILWLQACGSLEGNKEGKDATLTSSFADCNGIL